MQRQTEPETNITISTFEDLRILIRDPDEGVIYSVDLGEVIPTDE